MIREATEEDAPRIRAMIGELAEYERLAHQVACTEEDIRRELFGPAAVATASLAVAEDGEVAGMALWFPTFSTFLGRRGIWLEDLYVREPYRRRGFGRALLDHLRHHTDGRVEWSVLDWNQRAIDFYRELGACPLDGWTTYRWE